jgi:hypothetical protein
LTIKYKNKSGKELSVSFDTPNSARVSWNISSKSYTKISDVLPIIQGAPVPRSLNIMCSASELPCSVPNCPNQAEHWHHVKHQKKVKVKDRQKTILALTAKQIPVCTLHHKLIHSGKYDGPSLRKMLGYTLSDFD